MHVETPEGIYYMQHRLESTLNKSNMFKSLMETQQPLQILAEICAKIRVISETLELNTTSFGAYVKAMLAVAWPCTRAIIQPLFCLKGCTNRFSMLLQTHACKLHLVLT